MTNNIIKLAVQDLKNYSKNNLRTLYRYYGVFNIPQLAKKIHYPYFQKAQMQSGTVEQGTDGNKYRYVRKIGSGSYGSVWLAQSNKDQLVAIKIYDIRIVKELIPLSEIEVLKDLSTTNSICNEYAICLLDYYTVNSEFRIVTQYINGEDLDDYRKKFTIAERNKRLDIINNLVLGMDAFHNLGITHQDLKEQNIMWDTVNGRFKYTDWGLGCLKKYCDQRMNEMIYCNETKTGGYGCGSSGPAYTMAPGLKFGRANFKSFEDSKAHDIWSLGVILLDWYTLSEDEDILDKYYHDNGELKKTALYYKSNIEIMDILDQIENSEAKTIIDLLLEREIPDRIANWNHVLELIKN